MPLPRPLLPTLRRLVPAVLLLGPLAACGGAGGSGTATPPRIPPTPPTQAAFTALPATTLDPGSFTLTPRVATDAAFVRFNDDADLDLLYVFNGPHFTTSVPTQQQLGMGGNGDGTFTPGLGGTGFDGPAAPAIEAGDPMGGGLGGAAYVFSTATGHLFVSTTYRTATAFVGGVGFAIDTENAGLALGDADGDGLDDVIVADAAHDRVVVFVSNGMDSQLDAPVYAAVPTGFSPRAPVAADFDGDLHDDVVVRGASGALLVLLGGGSALLTPAPAPLALGGASRQVLAVAAGDVDLDGAPDLLGVLREGAGPRQGFTMLGRGDGTFDLPVLSPLSAALAAADPVRPRAADLNGDGRADLVYVVPALARAVVLLTDSAGGLTECTDAALAVPGAATSVCVADLDHDGDLDLGVLDGPAMSLRVLLNSTP